ncbi:tripartite tricarboxylate transporter substrate-binding protein [Rhodoplanes sp. TEM]|uniref:Tripartite tricarboxylate transporter substrate-binding protein n=1 Tax=Rhodoplanes tepidamans TaxID=200616 RepID=A0ABT5J4C4_RHOTP|nr:MULTISPECIES: tripartite tricarboxylate transporter substrate-binding protein [Rhodoplanes]MDC7784297.1 tripartite tricarboxylate transporter substrate-binding protein [Rhodoplanes tepidamans]MDC7983689.1 tripartite tricarboxylate transporter substrate-binding protein [Rhodoplanes sp. TEM]MDQ0353699.1 tripartite-type tricarboxylate transporter receptor subunit TctC [Rhodoplanes tepidamans]
MNLVLRLAAVAMLAGSLPAAADDFPTRPVTMVVPFAAGGTSDVIARVVSEQMGQVLGQRLINENVPGAGGTTALARVARAVPDGYMIAIGNVGTNAAAYAIYPEIKYTADDFVPIGLAAKTVPVIAVRKDFPATDLKSFIAHAKANPGKVNLGHAGVGSSNYLICKTFMAAAGIDVTLVSYRGAAPALNDLMGGQVDGVCDAAASVSGAIQNGLVRGLVVSAPHRMRTIPDVPTAAEAGLPEWQQQGWNALFAPKGTPQAAIDKLNAALRKAVASDALQKRMDDLGSIPATEEEMSPAAAGRLVAAEIEKYRKVLGPPQ